MGRRAKLGGYVWLAPMVAFLLAFELWPFLAMLDQSVHALSFTQPSMNGRFVGLNNYRKLVFDEDFFHSVRLTLLFLLVALPLEVDLVGEDGRQFGRGARPRLFPHGSTPRLTSTRRWRRSIERFPRSPSSNSPASRASPRLGDWPFGRF